MSSFSDPSKFKHSESLSGDSKAAMRQPMPQVVESALKAIGVIADGVTEEIHVKGGVACYYYALHYLGEDTRHLALRAVSLDIDWTCKGDHSTTNKHLAILGDASGQSVHFTEDLETYGHITFGSKIGRGSVKVGGSNVELDLIPICRFAPDQSRYMYEFGVETSSEPTLTPRIALQGVRLNSREVILCEKLSLGRGADMSKFDMVDSALLLALAPISISSITRVIQHQTAQEGFDGTTSTQSRRDAIAVSLEQAGITTGNTEAALSALSGTRLKQLALTARIAESLGKIDDTTMLYFFNGQTPKALAVKLQVQLAENIQTLKSTLSVLAAKLLRD